MPNKSARRVFHHVRALPRMSWNVDNLYNLWLRTTPGTRVASQTSFNNAQRTLFQQRWVAKRLTKGYHAEQIPAKKFERWFLPATLPRINRDTTVTAGASELSKWVEGREAAGGRTGMKKRAVQQEKEASAPVGPMMFMETERRLDSLVFRACFATSIWQARAFVLGGHVKLNGRLERNPNMLLNPGDIFTVNPRVVFMTQSPDTLLDAKRDAKGEAEVPEEAKEEAQESTEEAAEPTAEKTEAEAEAETEAETDGAEKTEAELAEAAEARPAPAKRVEPTYYSRSVAGTHFTLPNYASPHIFVPAYLLPSYLTCSAVYVRHPTARPGYSEIPSPFDATGSMNSLSWEYYQRHSPRMRDNRRARLMDPQRSQDRK